MAKSASCVCTAVRRKLKQASNEYQRGRQFHQQPKQPTCRFKWTQNDVCGMREWSEYSFSFHLHLRKPRPKSCQNSLLGSQANLDLMQSERILFLFTKKMQWYIHIFSLNLNNLSTVTTGIFYACGIRTAISLLLPSWQVFRCFDRFLHPTPPDKKLTSCDRGRSIQICCTTPIVKKNVVLQQAVLTWAGVVAHIYWYITRVERVCKVFYPPLYGV